MIASRMRSSVFKISSVNVETTTTYTVNRPSTYGFLPLGGHKILRVRGGLLLLLLLLLLLNVLPVSVKFIQCQTVLRNALKTSPNQSIKQLWKSTNQHTNIQYDIYNSTKEVLKEFHSAQEDKLKHQSVRGRSSPTLPGFHFYS